LGTARVDFYVLPQADERGRLTLACRLAEKACLLDHRVFLRAASAAEAQALDDLLWTFADRSFVPHELAGTGREQDVPVVIGHDAGPETHADLLVNLGQDVPAGFGRYARIAEVIDGDEQRRQLGRERFRFYREQGIEPDSHRIGARDEP
jgi:DNA polymerase-3 subunit chi